jgi:hypothetical protein
VLECPGCRSKASIFYADGGNTIDKVEWYRDRSHKDNPYKTLSFMEVIQMGVNKIDPGVFPAFDLFKFHTIVTDEEIKVIDAFDIPNWMYIKLLIIKKNGFIRVYRQPEMYNLVNPPSMTAPSKIKYVLCVNYSDLLKASIDIQNLNGAYRILMDELKVFKHLLIDFDEN